MISTFSIFIDMYNPMTWCHYVLSIPQIGAFYLMEAIVLTYQEDTGLGKSKRNLKQLERLSPFEWGDRNNRVFWLSDKRHH